MRAPRSGVAAGLLGALLSIAFVGVLAVVLRVSGAPEGFVRTTCEIAFVTTMFAVVSRALSVHD